MSEDEGREPPRQVWHFALIVVAAFALLASAFLGSRPLLYGMTNNVAPAGTAPAGLWPDDWSVTIARRDWNAPASALLGHGRPGRPARLGWVVREATLLSLPLGAWRQSDVAVFTEDAYGYRLAGLTPEQLADLDRRGAVGWFQWWRFVWGWLPLAAFAGFVWAELGWQARRRALLGLM